MDLILSIFFKFLNIMFRRDKKSKKNNLDKILNYITKNEVIKKIFGQLLKV